MSFDRPRRAMTPVDRPVHGSRPRSPLPGNEPGMPVIDEWAAPRTGEQVPIARRRVGVLAEKVLGCAERAAEAGLAAGELLANAVVHGAGPEMAVRVGAAGRVLRVEIRDGGGGPIGEPEDGPLAESGRGLVLVAALTSRFGLAASAEGTCAWFEAEP
ncbi:ATP-binding protein [Actinomadura scrupuli]|uniref:ATP-binding protein n=1 Tax=Actinomadura scrupuli TaxID=559629 RepID=UPI003D959ADD